MQCLLICFKPFGIVSTALHIALCSLPYSARLEGNQRAGALSLFVIVSALRAYKQLRVPLAWRGGTKTKAAGRINKRTAAEIKKYIGPGWWLQPVPMPLFGPGWWLQPGPKGIHASAFHWLGFLFFF